MQWCFSLILHSVWVSLNVRQICEIFICQPQFYIRVNSEDTEKHSFLVVSSNIEVWLAEGSVNLSCRVADVKVVTHNGLLWLWCKVVWWPSPSFMSILFQCLDMAYSEIFCKCTLRRKSRSLNPLGRSLL